MLFLIVGGLGMGVRAITRGESPPADTATSDADDSTSTETHDTTPDSVDPSPDSAISEDSGSSDTTVATTGESQPPTADHKLRLFIVGDSLAGGLGPVLTVRVEDTGLVEADTLYRVSSGLTRPDFYDWPAVLDRTIPLAQPDVVVAQFGGNDAQAITVEGQGYSPGTPEFAEEYASRVGEVMDFLRADGRTLIWVGLPNAPRQEFRERLQIVVGIQKAEADKRPDVVYVDSWAIFTGRDGGFASYVLDPSDGELKDVRAKDEFHLNATGESILALYVGDKVLEEVRERGGDV